MKNKQQLRDEHQEMKSVNENIYDMFSIAELEERLQMSALFWGCGNNCSSVCDTVCPCNVLECPCNIDCVPNCSLIEQCFPVVQQ
ncbi:MAG: hypothetical protein JNM68_10855 [Dinghuibacter sp.]|nr:hypothetical protein [Dinghuibacter sp.]